MQTKLGLMVLKIQTWDILKAGKTSDFFCQTGHWLEPGSNKKSPTSQKNEQKRCPKLSLNKQKQKNYPKEKCWRKKTVVYIFFSLSLSFGR